MCGCRDLGSSAVLTSHLARPPDFSFCPAGLPASPLRFSEALCSGKNVCFSGKGNRGGHGMDTVILIVF